MSTAAPRQYIRHQVSPALAASREATFWDPRPRYWARLDEGRPPEILALRERMRAEARDLLTLGLVPTSRRELSRAFGVSEWRVRAEKAQPLLHVGPRDLAGYVERLKEVGRLRLTAPVCVDDLEAAAERWDRQGTPKRTDELGDLVRRKLSLSTWRALSGFSADELVAHVRQVHVLFLGRQPTKSELMRSWERILICTSYALSKRAARQCATLGEHLEQVALVCRGIRESSSYSFRFIRGEIHPKKGVALDRRRDAAFVVYEPLWDARVEEAYQHADGVQEDQERQERQEKLPLPLPPKPKPGARQEVLSTIAELVAGALAPGAYRGDRATAAAHAGRWVGDGGLEELVDELEARGISRGDLLDLLEESGVDPPA